MKIIESEEIFPDVLPIIFNNNEENRQKTPLLCRGTIVAISEHKNQSDTFTYTMSIKTSLSEYSFRTSKLGLLTLIPSSLKIVRDRITNDLITVQIDLSVFLQKRIVFWYNKSLFRICIITNSDEILIAHHNEQLETKIHDDTEEIL